MSYEYIAGKFGWPMLNNKFVSAFSSEVKSIISAETDKYLAKASLIDIGAFVPNIDTDRNIDLLPVAFNAFVVNRVNKNDDVIDTETAIANYKNFINKPMNVEHDRRDVVGVILTAGFSEFGTDKPLTEEQVSKMTSPFNVVLGGVVWRMVDNNISNKIEDSSDPASLRFGDISASWELGFEDHEIVKIDGASKNLEDGIVINDATQIEELSKLLKSSKGSGKDGSFRLYRKPIGDIVPFGIGFTAAPAAEVQGVATPKTVENTIKAEDDVVAVSEHNKAESENIISQSKETDVFIVDETLNSMKIKNLNDITEESIKTMKASSVREFVEESIQEASVLFTQEKEKSDKALELAKAQSLEVSKQMQESAKQLIVIQAELKKLQEEKESLRRVEDFNKRMAGLDSQYELSADISKVLANQIKTIESDEAFAAWQENIIVLLKPFDRATKSQSAEATAAAEKKALESKASEVVLDEALDSATVAKGTVVIPNASGGEKTKDKWANALLEEDIEIK